MLNNKTKLKKLIAKLDAGKPVSLRDLENVLGIDAVVEYEKLWKADLKHRGFF